MDCLAVIGFSALGIFVGLIVGWFVNAEEEPKAKAYSAIILAVGSVGVGLLPLFAPKGGHEMWFYPIGLLGGLLVAPFLDIAFNWLYGREIVRRIHWELDQKYVPPEKKPK